MNTGINTLPGTTESNVLSFDPRISDPEKKIGELRYLVKLLEGENRELKEVVIVQNCFGTALRNLAQLYFSCDDHARRCASPDGSLATEEVARNHWRRHGGPEAFFREFPTPEDVIHFFRMSHSVRKKMQNFTPKG